MSHVKLSSAKALIVGAGSIGLRHGRVLESLGHDIRYLSRRQESHPKVLGSDLQHALSEFDPNFVVIANKTHEHIKTFMELDSAGYRGKVLVEKPLGFGVDTKIVSKLTSAELRAQTFVGYNLRFHPLLKELFSRTRNQKILSAHCYVGQHLSLWRRGQDYQHSYSSRKEEGGGALRDLSHELDFLTWILGPIKRVAGISGHFSSLEITSDDVSAMLMTTRNCPAVTVQLNYLDHIVQRQLTINTEEVTYSLDLIKGTLKINQEEKSIQLDRDDSYTQMHKALLDGNTEDLCTFDSGLKILDVIDCIERSATTSQFIQPEENL